MNWNQSDVIQEMKIPCFNPKQLEEDDMINLFGHLSFEETNAGSEMTDVLATDKHTAPRLVKSVTLRKYQLLTQTDMKKGGLYQPHLGASTMPNASRWEYAKLQIK